VIIYSSIISRVAKQRPVVRARKLKYLPQAQAGALSRETTPGSQGTETYEEGCTSSILMSLPFWARDASNRCLLRMVANVVYADRLEALEACRRCPDAVLVAGRCPKGRSPRGVDAEGNHQAGHRPGEPGTR
jgi:hypothetical protein